MNLIINGLFFDGSSSTKQSCHLTYNHHGQIIIQDTTYLADDVEISPRVGNTMRYIDFPDGSLFETNDNDSIDTLQATIKPSKLHHLIYKLEKAKTLVTASLLILVVGGWAFIQYGLPHMSHELAMKLPEDTLQHLGDAMLDALDEDIFKTSEISLERQRELSKIFHNLNKQIGSKTSRIEYRYSDIIGANALALPNGVVVITDQLLDLVSKDEEIISIMLHELGHVENRHILRSMIQSFSMTFFVMAVTGDVSTASNVIASAPLIFVQAGYSQNMESEADTFSLDYMLANEIDPANFATIMKKLELSNSIEFLSCRQQDDKDIQSCLSLAMNEADESESKTRTFGSYLSTHPSTDERVKRFEKP